MSFETAAEDEDGLEEDELTANEDGFLRGYLGAGLEEPEREVVVDDAMDPEDAAFLAYREGAEI